jgi:hypothetical protein
MFPEFQGGAVDRPGGTGYDLCRNNTLNAAFERVFYHQVRRGPDSPCWLACSYNNTALGKRSYV